MVDRLDRPSGQGQPDPPFLAGQEVSLGMNVGIEAAIGSLMRVRHVLAEPGSGAEELTDVGHDQNSIRVRNHSC